MLSIWLNSSQIRQIELHFKNNMTIPLITITLYIQFLRRLQNRARKYNDYNMNHKEIRIPFIMITLRCVLALGVRHENHAGVHAVTWTWTQLVVSQCLASFATEKCASKLHKNKSSQDLGAKLLGYHGGVSCGKSA